MSSHIIWGASKTFGTCSHSIWIVETCAYLALPRIRNVRASKTKFRRPIDFSIGRFLEQSFGVFAKPSKAKHTIRIVFDAFAASRIQERQWHPSQKIKQLRDGGIELSLSLGNLEEIERRVLSWGTHAQVLAPSELKERLTKMASALTEIYRNAAA